MTVLLAFGMGYSATETARRLSRRGWRIIGTGRSHASLAGIAHDGFTAIPFGGAGNVSLELADGVLAATHILTSVPPDEQGDPVLRACAPLIAQAPALQWIGYLSTIGVYGDHGGGWIDEETPVNPMSARSKARVAAEREWADLGARCGATVDIFRLAGIYGPGRSPFERLRAGESHRVFKPGQVFNRIHVDDIATTVIAAMDRPSRSGETRIFNVTDDEPAPPQDVTAFAAVLIGRTPPPLLPFEQAQLSDMARSFYNENKRVKNERIKTSLGVTLRHPTYREGLRAIADGLRAPSDA